MSQYEMWDLQEQVSRALSLLHALELVRDSNADPDSHDELSVLGNESLSRCFGVAEAASIGRRHGMREARRFMAKHTINDLRAMRQVEMLVREMSGQDLHWGVHSVRNRPQ